MVHYRWYMSWCKLFWECSQQSAWNYTTKSQIALPKDVTEIANERVYATPLSMLFKMDLRVQMDAKSGQLKIESMSSGVPLKGELIIFNNIYIHKHAQEGAPDGALKGTLLVAIELHVFMQLSMHKSVQNDLTF